MNQAEYFRTHPPRCIAGFVASPDLLPNVESDGHVGMSQLDFEVPEGVTIDAPEQMYPIFALACRCGGQRHYIYCYRWANPYFGNQIVTLSPIDLECALCGVKTPLIDIDLHGYDPELGIKSATSRALGDHCVFECESCGKQAFEVFAQFEYPDDLFDGDFPEFAGREQELFTWFSLFGRCEGCSRELVVAEFECA